MRHPVFSMPSIVDKLKSIVPDVPDPMMEAAEGDPARRYLLKQASVLDQQNVIIGGALDTLIEQAKLTNGRVNVLEPKVDEHAKFVDAAKSKVERSKWNLEILWIPVGLVALQVIAHKIGLL